MPFSKIGSSLCISKLPKTVLEARKRNISLPFLPYIFYNEEDSMDNTINMSV
jgi:hypothetical protein